MRVTKQTACSMLAALALSSCEKRIPAPPETHALVVEADGVHGPQVPMAELRFVPMELTGLPPLKTTEFFGRQEPDSLEFVEPFTEALEAKYGTAVEQTQLFNGGASRNSLAFVYLKDLRIRAVEFTGDQSLTRWLVALAEGWEGGSEHRVTTSGLDASRFTDWDDLLNDPGAWARRKAPKSHHRAELTDEKEAYFAFAATDVNTEFDTTRFQTALDALMKSRKTLPTAPQDADIEALEQAIGTPLPKDVRALYAATGGVDDLFHGFDLISASAAAAERASWTKIYEEWSLEELQSHQTAEPGVHPVYCTPRWIPFVDLVGGNYLAIDLAPASGGAYGQIIVAGRDVDHKRRVAASLTEFLEKAASYDGSKSHELSSVLGELKF